MRTFRHADEIVEAGYRISEKSIELADAIVPASVLRFTQNTASATTRFCPKMYLDDLTGWLATDGFRGAPLNVVQIDGTYYSLDHRRLIAAKILNVEVPINILDLNDPKVMREFQRKRSGLELGTEGLYIDISGTSIRITVDGRITSAR
jgi:hypothetical protein